MNLLKLSFVILLTILGTSCGDNLSKKCSQDDWVGTYSGTLNCELDSEPVTVTIIASDKKEIIISHKTTGAILLETGYDALEPDGCELDNTAIGNGFTFTVDVDLNVDNLTIKETFTDGTDTSICTISATRD